MESAPLSKRLMRPNAGFARPGWRRYVTGVPSAKAALLRNRGQEVDVAGAAQVLAAHAEVAEVTA